MVDVTLLPMWSRGVLYLEDGTEIIVIEAGGVAVTNACKAYMLDTVVPPSGDLPPRPVRYVGPQLYLDGEPVFPTDTQGEPR